MACPYVADLSPPISVLSPLAGVSLEGSILVDRSDANAKAYQRSCTAKQILSGAIEMPPFAAGLIGTIERLSLTGAMSESSRAEEIEPGAGRESWDMDGDLSDAEYYYGNHNNRSSPRRRNESTGLEQPFSRADISDRYSNSPRNPATPNRTRGSTSRAGGGGGGGGDPFASEADDPDDDPAYSLDRDNATRNTGTYGFSSAGGGSVTNSPSTSKGGTDSRQRSGSKSGGSKISGYFDDYIPSPKESAAYSPIDGNRPTIGHRKTSSSFSIPKFGKNKTPPPFGPAASRKTPPASSSALLSNRFPEDFSAARTSEDELGPNYRNASPGPASPAHPLFGAPDYSSPGISSRSSPSNRPTPLPRHSSSYLSSGLKKMSPAEAVLAAQRTGAPSGAGAAAEARRKADAFGDLWEAERYRTNRPSTDMDDLDRELQSGSSRRPQQPRASSSQFSSSNNGFSSPYEQPAGAAARKSPLSAFRSSNSMGNITSSLGRFRSSSGGPSKASQQLLQQQQQQRQQQQDVWQGFSSAEEDDALHRDSWSSSAPPNRASSTTPKGYLNGGRSHGSNHQTSLDSPFDDSVAQTSSRRGNDPAVAAAAAASSLPSLGRVVASFDFTGQEQDDLTFQRGDVIVVLKKTDSVNDWWLGRNDSKGGIVGSFPANFVEIVE